jgi:hypothetical protein
VGEVVMTRKEYLLIVLAEELAETQKEVSKMLRFGYTESRIGSGVTNIEKAAVELNEALAIAEELGLFDIMDDARSKDLRAKKLARVEEHWKLKEFSEA